MYLFLVHIYKCLKLMFFMAEKQFTPKTSKINSGMLQVIRLDLLWKDAHFHSRNGMYRKWNEDLDRIWCELAGDVKEDVKEGEKTEAEKYEDLDKEYVKTISNIQKKGFKSYSDEDLKKLHFQKKALMNKETFLRKLQNKQGKGTAYDLDDDDFD